MAAPMSKGRTMAAAISETGTKAVDMLLFTRLLANLAITQHNKLL